VGFPKVMSQLRDANRRIGPGRGDGRREVQVRDQNEGQSAEEKKKKVTGSGDESRPREGSYFLRQ